MKKHNSATENLNLNMPTSSESSTPFNRLLKRLLEDESNDESVLKRLRESVTNDEAVNENFPVELTDATKAKEPATISAEHSISQFDCSTLNEDAFISLLTPQSMIEETALTVENELDDAALLEKTVDFPVSLVSEDQTKTSQLLEAKQQELRNFYIRKMQIETTVQNESERYTLLVDLNSKLIPLVEEIESLKSALKHSTNLEKVASSFNAKPDESRFLSLGTPQNFPPTKHYSSIALTLLNNKPPKDDADAKIYLPPEQYNLFREVSVDLKAKAFDYQRLMHTYYSYKEFRMITRGSTNIHNALKRSLSIVFPSNKIGEIFFMTVNFCQSLVSAQDKGKFKQFLVDFWDGNKLLHEFLKECLENESKKPDRFSAKLFMKDVILLFKDEPFLEVFFKDLSLSQKTLINYRKKYIPDNYVNNPCPTLYSADLKVINQVLTAEIDKHPTSLSTKKYGTT